MLDNYIKVLAWYAWDKLAELIKHMIMMVAILIGIFMATLFILNSTLGFL